MGPITSIHSHNKGTEVITASGDKTIKLWKIVYKECKDEEKCLIGVKSLNGLRIALSLELLSIIQLPSLPEVISINETFQKIGFGNHSNLILFERLDNNTFTSIFPESLDDNHGDKITSLSFSTDINIFATASIDGSVKIWNEKNGLIRFDHKSFSCYF